MNRRQQLACVLFVAVTMLQNYESQISRVSTAEILTWHVHDWAGAIVRVLIAGGLAWKAFLSDSGTAGQPPKP